MVATALTKPLRLLKQSRTVVLSIVAVVVLALVVGVIAVHAASGTTAAGPVKPKQPAAAHQQARPASPPAALAVTSVDPAAGTTGVATSAVLTVTYSSPLSSALPTPTLSPAVAGTWTHSGPVMTFVPAAGWVPFTTETLTVPAGAVAIVGKVKLVSTSPTTSSFVVQAGSQTRLEQLLAQLNYLPFTFTPAPSLPPAVVFAGGAATTTSAVSTSPLPGTLTWSWPTVPATLSALWTPGQPNVLDRGAIMAFESDHKMKMDGIASPQVWSALLAAAAAGQVDSQPYDYLVASESIPETLKVYRDGQVIYSTLVNTGVPGAATQQGTFPVYLRFATTTMSGTNVDGSKYVDAGIPWVAYFNGGDAVHGFVRHSYGSPQSNGCVELPVSNAASVWPLDPYGTLVTVTS